MAVAFQRMFGILERWNNNEVTPSLSKPHELSYRSNRIHTTAYHPSSNGMIERWHRNFKAAIMCHADASWTHFLSTVMLDLRSYVLDAGTSPAEFVYGTSLRTPGEFVLPEDLSPNPQIFLEEFRKHKQEIEPVSIAHKYEKKIFFNKD